MTSAKKKSARKPNEFASLLSIITIVLIVGFLVQSSLMVIKENPLASLFSDNPVSPVEHEDQP